MDCVLDGASHEEGEPGALIIEAAHDQGVEIPHSCRGGMCCTCLCRVVEGEVAMDVNYSLEPWELEAGYVLACQSRPLDAEGDARLRRDVAGEIKRIRHLGAQQATGFDVRTFADRRGGLSVGRKAVI